MLSTSFHRRPLTRNAVYVTRVSAFLLLVSAVSVAIFGIGVPPIWQGMTGILVAFEGFNGAETVNTLRVLIFIVGVVIYGVLSFALGITAYFGEAFSINCTVPEVLGVVDESISVNFQVCSGSIRLYAVVQLLSGAALSVAILLVVIPAYKEMKRGVEAANKQRKGVDLKHFILKDE